MRWHGNWINLRSKAMRKFYFGFPFVRCDLFDGGDTHKTIAVKKGNS